MKKESSKFNYIRVNTEQRNGVVSLHKKGRYREKKNAKGKEVHVRYEAGKRRADGV